jgi:hypothetical protein
MGLLKEICNFLLNSALSYVVGIVGLIFFLIFLPETITIAIINKLNPNIANRIKEPLIKFIKKIANLYINNELIELSVDENEYNEKTSYYLKENKNIDKNIYVIDLCKDLVFTLRFMYPENRYVGEHFEQALNYLKNYASIAEQLDQDKNFLSNFFDKIDSLKTNLTERCDYMGNEAMKTVFEQGVDKIFNYLREERRKLEELRKNNKNILISLLQGKANEL